MKKLGLYLLRWQLSTPILAVVVALTSQELGNTWSAVIANFIGGLIFFNIDKFIFKKK